MLCSIFSYVLKKKKKKKKISSSSLQKQECIEILKYFLNNEGVGERKEVGGQSEGKSAVPGLVILYNPEQRCFF